MPSHTSATQYPCSEITHHFTIQVFKYDLLLPCCHKYRIYTLLTPFASKIETVHNYAYEYSFYQVAFCYFQMLFSWDDNGLNLHTKGEVSGAEAL